MFSKKLHSLSSNEERPNSIAAIVPGEIDRIAGSTKENFKRNKLPSPKKLFFFFNFYTEEFEKKITKKHVLSNSEKSENCERNFMIKLDMHYAIYVLYAFVIFNYHIKKFYRIAHPFELPRIKLRSTPRAVNLRKCVLSRLLAFTSNGCCLMR